MVKRGDNTIDMTQGRPLPLVLKFTLPILLGNIFQQLYTVVDGIVVGKNVSDAAQAAVGASFSVTYMFTSLFLGIGLGGSVLVSQYFGQHNGKDIQKTIATMNTFLLVVSLPLTVFGMLTAGPFLSLLKVQEDYFELARVYMCVYYLGLLPQFGYNANAGILQGLGDSRSPLIILALSSVLHVVLDYVLVVPIPLGVVGVGLATVLSQLFSWLMSVWMINHKFPEYRFRVLRISFDREIFKNILRIGVPSGVQNALYSVGIMVMSPLINQCGTVFVAGYNAAVKVDGFVFMPVQSLATSITTYVGQNIGAKRMDRVKEGVRDIMLLSVAMCAVLCAVVIPLRSQLMWLFTDTQAVVDAGNEYLVRVIPLYIISTLQYMYIGLLRGAGESTVPTVAALASLWLARVPSAYYLTDKFGPANMHWCYAIGWAAGLCVLIPYYYSGRWKRHINKLQPTEEQGNAGKGDDGCSKPD